MRPLDGLGLFWLPGHEEDSLSGRLRFDPASGTTLRLVGKFDHAAQDNGEPVTRIVGWLGNKRVTLDRCFSSGSSFPVPGVAETEYHANRLFLEHHLTLGEPAFKTAELTLSNLDDWVNRSGITEQRHFMDTPVPAVPLYELSFNPLDEQSYPFSRGQIVLVFQWHGDGDPIHGMHLKQWPVFRIEYDELRPLGEIEQDASRIQNLMTLCLDTRVEVDRFILRRPDVRQRMLSGKEIKIEQPVEFLVPPVGHTESDERKARHRHQMLLTFDDLGGLPTVARWLNESPRFQRALDSFMSIRRAREMFAENRFLNVTFAAEAFHRITQGGVQMDDTVFAELLNTYLEHTPEEHHDWLRSRIAHGNAPTLRKRLLQLATRAGTATKPLVRDKRRWARTLAQVRNELTHLGTNSRMFEGSDLVFLTESVYAVARACMLLECGVSPEALEKQAASYQMTWYRERLAEAIDRVYAQFKI